VLGVAGAWLAAPVAWPAWPAVLWAAVLALAAGALRTAQGSLDRRMLMPSASDPAA
jgi:hypothetical protein